MSVSYGGDSITFADGSVTSSGWTGFKNRVINGAMAVDQRGTASTPVYSINQSGTGFTLDRYQYYRDNSAANTSVQRTTTAPAGFKYSARITINTGNSTVSANNEGQFRHSIEGYNIADLNWGTADAKPVTISFWIRSSIAGTYSFGLQNYDVSSVYATTYTINAQNTWEYKTITIPGPTSGTFLTDTSYGIHLIFDVGGGSNFQTTANVWTTGNKYCVAGTTKLQATTGATMYITGLQFESGSTASSFEYRPYGTELQLCQRYFWLCNGSTYNYSISGSGEIGGAGMLNINFPVSMRTAPATIGFTGSCPYFYYNSVGGARQNGTFTANSISTYSAGTNAMRVITGAAGATGLYFWIDVGGGATGAFSISAE